MMQLGNAFSLLAGNYERVQLFLTVYAILEYKHQHLQRYKRMWQVCPNSITANNGAIPTENWIRIFS